MNRFAGKTIVVTGAASGIGAACVQRLLSEGACMAAADASPAGADAFAGEPSVAPRLWSATVDVTAAAAVRSFIEAARQRDGGQTACIPSF